MRATKKKAPKAKRGAATKMRSPGIRKIRAAVAEAQGEPSVERPAGGTREERRWQEKIIAQKWTVESMPIEPLRRMASVLQHEIAASLLATKWAAIAKRLGIDPKMSRADLRKSMRGAPRARLTLEEKKKRSDESLAKMKAKKADQERAENSREMLDDAHLAVPLDSLPIGSIVKTPDRPRIGVRGVSFKLLALNSGGATITKTARLGAYIARASMVVPLGMDAAYTIDAGAEA
jgi:hypothetical protein